jgi:nucleoid-associated protein Lsr2
VLIDDLTGDPADTTVTFSLDRTDYQIDLSDDNAAELRETLSRYVDAGRTAPVRDGKAAYAGYYAAAVRAWANGRGIEVNARGRIKADVVEQSRAAGNGRHDSRSATRSLFRDDAAD